MMVSGGSASPNPPPLASASGLVRRSSASPSGRFLNHHQFVEPLKTKFSYADRMSRPKKKDRREKFLYEFCGSQGAQTPAPLPHANPGLPPHTPPVKNIPGGPPSPSNEWIITVIMIVIIVTIIIIISGLGATFYWR